MGNTKNKQPSTKKKPAVKKQTVVKNTTSKKPKLNKVVAKKLKSKKAPDPIEKKITIVCIIVAAVAVVASLFIGFFFNSERVAQRKLAELAKDYYENYYYDKFMQTIDDESLEEAFGKNEERGFAPVYLRQLLLFDNERNTKYEKYFSTSGYKCNKNETKIQIFPEAPYGKTNYKVEYVFSCNND